MQGVWEARRMSEGPEYNPIPKEAIKSTDQFRTDLVQSIANSRSSIFLTVAMIGATRFECYLATI